MTSYLTYDPIADLEAALAAQSAEELNKTLTHRIGTAAAPLAPRAILRPRIVADAAIGFAGNNLCSKAFAVCDNHTSQCVIPTTSTTTHLSTSSLHPVQSIAGKQSCESETSSFEQTRQPRRASAKLKNVALKKTWSGLKSKGRKDKLTKYEKFSAAVWQTASKGGLAVSLNFGVRRATMLWVNADPRRRLMQNLNEHLSKAGFSALPYALAFDITPEASVGRLHLHGAIDTSGLTDSDIQRLGTALCKAASFADGPISGERQLHLGPLYNPAGWVDYVLREMARTKRELKVDDITMMNDPMRRLAKDYFEGFRAEVISQVKNDAQACKKRQVNRSKTTKTFAERFTSRPACGTKNLSGERDQKVVGGARKHKLYRPHQLRVQTTTERLIPPSRHSIIRSNIIMRSTPRFRFVE